MTPHQKSQVWEIRRKSKNRLAAAKCRKRKLEDIRQNDENFDQLRDQFAERLRLGLKFVQKELKIYFKIIHFSFQKKYK